MIDVAMSAAGATPDVRPPGQAKLLIDGFLTDTRHLSIMDGDRVRDFLLDLRAEV